MSAQLEITYVAPSELHPYGRNPRINDHAIGRIVASIAEFGFKFPVLARRNNEIVDGHLRWKGALQLGLDQIPVIYVDELTDTQIKGLRIVANRSATWAEWDEELLSLELADLDLAGFDLDLTGFDEDELAELLPSSGPVEMGNADEVPPLLEKAVSRRSDVWLCEPYFECSSCGRTFSYEEGQRLNQCNCDRGKD